MTGGIQGEKVTRFSVGNWDKNSKQKAWVIRARQRMQVNIKQEILSVFTSVFLMQRNCQRRWVLDWGRGRRPDQDTHQGP